MLEIARDGSAGAARNGRGMQRQLRVIVIDMHDVSLQRGHAQFLEGHLQSIAAMPENRAGALRIDEDDRAAVRRIAVDRASHIDTAALQGISDQPSVLVRSESAEIPAAQAQRRARGHHRGRLSAAQELPIADAHFPTGEHGSGLDRQLQDLVDRVGADTDYIQHW